MDVEYDFYDSLNDLEFAAEDDEYDDDVYEDEYDEEYDEGYDEMINFNDPDTIIMNGTYPEVYDDDEAPEIPVEDGLYEDYEDNKEYSSIIQYDREDPIVMMIASTQDDIVEARNHYEAMVRSTTVS